jgi:hypothetical protein
LRGEIAGHSVEFLRIIGAGFVGRALIAGLTNLLAARGLTLWNLGVSIAIVGLNVLFNMLLVGRLFGLPCFGVQGVAVATVLSWGLVSLGTLAWWCAVSGFIPRGCFWPWAGSASCATSFASGCLRRPSPSPTNSFRWRWPARSFASARSRSPRACTPPTWPIFPCSSAMAWASAPRSWFRTWWAPGILQPPTGGSRPRWPGARAFPSSARSRSPLSGHWLLGLFSRDTGIVALGALLLWIDVLVQPAKAANIAITFSLRAAGDSRFPAIVGSTLMWTVGIGAAFGLAFGAGWGVVGIWLGMAVDEWTRAVVNAWRWKSGAWQSKGVT